MDIKLGDICKDVVTNYEGMVIGIAYWLNGCKRMVLQSQVLNADGSPAQELWIDEQQLIVVEEHAYNRLRQCGEAESSDVEENDPHQASKCTESPKRRPKPIAVKEQVCNRLQSGKTVASVDAHDEDVDAEEDDLYYSREYPDSPGQRAIPNIYGANGEPVFLPGIAKPGQCVQENDGSVHRIGGPQNDPPSRYETPR